jgi:type II secretory ATPase GspE/PulE/Tfp pilus assembly ATPase PilB-like protein
MRQAAAKDGMQRMREAGMALVLEGVTSMEEMQRVFAAAARPQPPGVKRP